MHERFEKWIKTNEDWYPSYRPLEYGNKLDHTALRVRCQSPNPGRVEWLVCVWGADDFGMEMWSTEEEVKFLYSIIEDFTTVAALTTMGLLHC
jgi:hypothetical protein